MRRVYRSDSDVKAWAASNSLVPLAEPTGGSVLKSIRRYYDAAYNQWYVVFKYIL